MRVDKRLTLRRIVWRRYPILNVLEAPKRPVSSTSIRAAPRGRLTHGNGAGGRLRTCNARRFGPPLYRLSYPGVSQSRSSAWRQAVMWRAAILL